MLRAAITKALIGATAVLTSAAAMAAGAGSAAAASAQPGPWVGTWIASPQKPEQNGFNDVTLRLIVHTTIGGNHVRIRLSNEFGTTPLDIGAASVAIQSSGASVRPESLRPLRFGGQAGVSIPAGGQVTSDAVAEQLPADVNLAVSLYLPQPTGPPTEHADFGAAHQVSYISGAGDHADETGAANYPSTTTSWFFLDGVDVTDPGASAVVTLGDSITDGTHSTDNTNHRYPNWLADRLQQAGGPYQNLAVLNAGIGGNELLQTSACCGASPSGLDRFDSDVLSQPGVRDIIVMLGTNDILGAHHAGASAIIAGLQQLVSEAHARGVRIFGATITPSAQFTAAEEQTREAVNQWITTSGDFDGVVNFSGAVADRSKPQQLNPVYNSGDNLHPNDTGYHAMADAVDLTSLLAPGTAPGNVPPCLVQPSLTPIKAGAPLDVTCHPQPPGYTYDDTSSALSYSSGWTHVGASAGYTSGDYDQTESWSSQAGASVSVTFTGTGVEWVGPLGTNAGIAEVSIDGGPARQVDTYAPWGKQFQQDVFSAQRLSPGTHTLTITVTGTKNASSSGTGIVIDGIDVTPDPG